MGLIGLIGPIKGRGERRVGKNKKRAMLFVEITSLPRMPFQTY
jgi:hypothetical protein